MKLLTLNFLTCATRACKSQISATTTTTTNTSPYIEPVPSASADAGDPAVTDGKEGSETAEEKVSAGGAPFPLHVRDAELERVELAFNPLFLRNILSRIEWKAMHAVVNEVGLKLPVAPLTIAANTTEGLVTGDAGGEGDGMAIDTDTDTVPASSTAATGTNTGTSGVVAVNEHGIDDENRQGQTQDMDNDYDDEYLKQLHEILIETNIQTGKLVCGRCGHEYAIREGIANFLLPPHLV